MASASGRSPGHLARVFRKTHGCSVGQMRRRTQVAHVVRLLLDTDRPLSDIAHTAGFSDQSHMGRIFRRCAGLSPQAFRQAFAA